MVFCVSAYGIALQASTPSIPQVETHPTGLKPIHDDFAFLLTSVTNQKRQRIAAQGKYPLCRFSSSQQMTLFDIEVGGELLVPRASASVGIHQTLLGALCRAMGRTAEGDQRTRERLTRCGAQE